MKQKQAIADNDTDWDWDAPLSHDTIRKRQLRGIRRIQRARNTSLSKYLNNFLRTGYLWHKGASDFVLSVAPNDAAHLKDIKSVKDVAMMIVDIQDDMCRKGLRGSYESEKISRDFARVAPDFRAVGVDLFSFLYPDPNDETSNPSSYIHIPDPNKGDRVLIKTTDSIFKSTSIKAELNAKGKPCLLFAGVNANACIHASVINACKEGFQVYVCSDLVANGLMKDAFNTAKAIKSMRKAGAKFVLAQDALRHFRKLAK
jgi:nicotinamidase-related amidase